jgi:hypothetical protein
MSTIAFKQLGSSSRLFGRIQESDQHEVFVCSGSNAKCKLIKKQIKWGKGLKVDCCDRRTNPILPGTTMNSFRFVLTLTNVSSSLSFSASLALSTICMMAFEYSPCPPAELPVPFELPDALANELRMMTPSLLHTNTPITDLCVDSMRFRVSSISTCKTVDHFDLVRLQMRTVQCLRS